MEELQNENIVAPSEPEAVPPPPAREIKVEDLSDQQKALLSFEHFSNLFVKKLFESATSKKKMYRSAKAIAQGLLHPLSKTEPTFESSDERELFDLFQEASSAKMMLMMYGLEQSGAIKINQTLSQMAPPASETQTETKEETNGKQES